MAYLMKDESAEAVLRALCAWFQFYGVPDRISLDGGREFDNAHTREEMKALEVVWHLNTPGHPKSRGGIERLHTTLRYFLRVYQLEKGLEPDEVKERGIAAYHYSVHTVTGFAPFEILFGRGRWRDYRNTVTGKGEVINNSLALKKFWKARIEEEKWSKQVKKQNLP
ncbi:uncharacterized protein [Halyomorpha halys]|uniref:uncharacterized protein n=1 Tax=Halyomorpha halys TaxID=286706 RepID=UPI0034D2B430